MRNRSIVKNSLSALLFASLYVGLATHAHAQLYENIEVLGDLRCDANADIRTLIGSATRLRCAFTRAGNTPDIIRRYFGAVGAMEPGNLAGAGKTISWTVLRLKDPLRPTDQSEATILGSYSRAPSDVAATYGLQPGALIGGGARNIALEPRSTGEKNVAPAVTQFSLSN